MLRIVNHAAGTALLALLVVGNAYGLAVRKPAVTKHTVPARAAKPKSSPVKADAVDNYLTTQMRRAHIPGLAVAIVRDGKIVKLKGYGIADLEQNTPVTPDTPFQLAAASKILTGTALMALVQDGKIGLDDPVTKYLPDAPTAWAPITVRELAAHTSGLKAIDPPNTATLAEAVRMAAALPLDYTPGTQGAYGLTDFVVLTRVIEQATGQTFPEFLQARLLGPLGMTATRFDNAMENVPVRVSDTVPGRAGVYEWADGAQRNYDFLFPAFGYGAGGAYSSAADLARLAVALDTGKALTRATEEQMWSAPKLADGTEGPFGMGWVVRAYRGKAAVGHSGGPALADVLRFPDDHLTVIVLANQQTMYPYLAEGVADLLVPAPTHFREPAITDADPATTTKLRALLVAAARGDVDPALFTPDAQRDLVPTLQGVGPLYLGSLSPLSDFQLIGDKAAPTGGGRLRRYRAFYGTKTILWSFALTADGKIEGASSQSE